MAKARKAKQVQTKLNMLIYGETFTGKSTLASQLAYFKNTNGKPFRILYLDAEAGSIDEYLEDMEDNGVNLDNIYIVYTQSLGEVEQYIDKIKNNEDFYELDEDGIETDEIVKDADGEPFRADALVVDGATILNLTTQQGLAEFSKKRNKVKADKANLVGDERLVKIEGSGLEIKDWGVIKTKGQNLILNLMSSGVHCITTCREVDEKQSVKTDDGKFTSVATGRKIPEGFKGMEYNTKTVIRTFADSETGQICACVEKDRTGVHHKGEILEDPSLLDYQVVIDKNVNKDDFVLKNELNKAIETEQEIYAHEVLGDDEPTQQTMEQSSGESADSLRAEINATIKALPPVEKTNKKALLKEKGLPSAFKNVTDVVVLKAVLDALNS